MRAGLILLLLLTGPAVFAGSADPVPLPPEVQSGKWRMLDKSPRARTVADYTTIPVTESEFRNMRQRYRSEDFNMWAKRLRQLRPGMTEKEVMQVLRPKQAGPAITAGGMLWNTIILNDAYFADILVDPHSKRMISATPPLAMAYEIKPDKKAPQRPNQALERTADRHENVLSMTSTLKPETQLVLMPSHLFTCRYPRVLPVCPPTPQQGVFVSGRSACSR